MYLPHREVVKENCSTKKYDRFDANVKVKDNHTLNDIFYKGPCLPPKLYDLLAFWMKLIALTGDIEKEFLQIIVQVNHMDLFS